MVRCVILRSVVLAGLTLGGAVLLAVFGTFETGVVLLPNFLKRTSTSGREERAGVIRALEVMVPEQPGAKSRDGEQEDSCFCKHVFKGSRWLQFSFEL